MGGMENDGKSFPVSQNLPGWFAAGTSFGRALHVLSDGAFKLFAYICLQVERRTGGLEASQAKLAKAIGKSRRIVGKHIEEFQDKRVCTVASGKNQYGRTRFEIAEEYWPYMRSTPPEAQDAPADRSYVDAVENLFISTGCTTG